MNTYSLGPTFDPTLYYSTILNNVFVCLFYSGGIPILLLVGAFTQLFSYYSYKYILLRYAKRPPAYDHKLNKAILNILPLSIVFHLMISIYMYG